MKERGFIPLNQPFSYTLSYKLEKKKTLNEGVCVPITQFGENVGPFTKETPYAETVGIVNNLFICFAMYLNSPWLSNTLLV